MRGNGNAQITEVSGKFLPSRQKVKLEKVNFKCSDRGCCGITSWLTVSIVRYLRGPLRVIVETRSLRLCEKSKLFFRKGWAQAFVLDTLTFHIHLTLEALIWVV